MKHTYSSFANGTKLSFLVRFVKHDADSAAACSSSSPRAMNVSIKILPKEFIQYTYTVSKLNMAIFTTVDNRFATTIVND